MAFTRKFYTSDSHFGHAGMLTFGGRPFVSTDEMDRFLIDQWNSVVSNQDIVYHLGDFAVGDRDPVRIKKIFDQLKGRKHLVLGNHDIRSDGSIHPSIAALDWAAQPVAMMETRDEGERVILSHYAMRVWPASHHASWHFFGHSHGSLPSHGRSRDVGVDCADVAFTPRTFKELTAGMSGEIAALCRNFGSRLRVRTRTTGRTKSARCQTATLPQSPSCSDRSRRSPAVAN